MLKRHYPPRVAILCTLIAMLLPWGSIVHAEPASPQAFQSGGLAQILASRKGRPFLLSLWSTECPPCMKELDLMAKVRRKHPEFDVVMVSTDDDALGPQAQAMLEKHGLEGVESWIFAGANGQRLRFEIDPKWYGELPRSYFYDASHERLGISGALKPEQLEAWLKRIKAQP